MRSVSAVSVVAVLCVLSLSTSLVFASLVLAQAPGAMPAQEPEPPGGEPQPGLPEEPEEPAPEEPAPEEPGVEEPAAPAPGAEGGELPRTGWEAAGYAALGVLLLLAGARLRVVARIREVGERVSARLRRRSSEDTLREALEPIRAARLSPPEPDPDPGPLYVEPSTPSARRMTGVAERD